MNPLNLALDTIITVGDVLGYEPCVELSQHSIEISLERPNKEKRAWDDSLYKSGNVFVSGYANPIKPTVNENSELENHDTVNIDESNEGEPEPDKNVSVIASSRFRTYMKQDLISQLLTPQEQWKLIAYAVGVLAVLMFFNVFVSMSAAGLI